MRKYVTHIEQAKEILIYTAQN